MKITDQFDRPGLEKVQVAGRDGDYVEKYDIVSKYERVEDKISDMELSYSQFAKMYTPAWKDNTENTESHNDEIDRSHENEDKSNIEEGIDLYQEDDKDLKMRI